MRRVIARLVVVAGVLSVASCQPPDRDIRVSWRDGRLVVDFPWSLWRLIGLQDRDYCVQRIELYDVSNLLWMAELNEDAQCKDVRMPVVLGSPLAGFSSVGQPSLKQGRTYGVAFEGIGHGRVAFVLSGRRVQNITERYELSPPCAGVWRCEVQVQGPT